MYTVEIEDGIRNEWTNDSGTRCSGHMFIVDVALQDCRLFFDVAFHMRSGYVDIFALGKFDARTHCVPIIRRIAKRIIESEAFD